tara:strand:+ start:5577 stop:6803 length:1227 start_codon:yes stop_codon:yes gene_type:complete
MITYKGIITYFEAMCDAHQQINSFTYGEVDLFDKDKFTEYPALHLTPTGTAIDDQTIVYGFDVVVFDRYNVATNKMSNEATCLSDSLQILQDICKELTNGKYFINEDTLISMDVPVVCQPFIDTEPDNCSGWTTTFNVITPNESTACNIPYFPTEQWRGYNFTLPDSVPDAHAWYSILNVTSRLVVDGTTGNIVSLSPIVDTLPSTDTLTLSGSSVDLDIVKNGLYFNNQSQSSVCFLGKDNVTTNAMTFFITIKDFSRFGTSNVANNIMGFKGDNGTTECKLKINTLGNIEFERVGATAPHPQSTFPIVSTEGTNFDTAPRRIEPLSIAITFFYNDDYIKVYYGNDNSETILIDTDGFNIGLYGEFWIGSEEATDTSNFYLKEFLVCTERMTDTNKIFNIMEWLKYR